MLGFLVALVEWRWGWLGAPGRSVIEFLGSVGIVFLLFRVGLESRVSKLLENFGIPRVPAARQDALDR